MPLQRRLPKRGFRNLFRQEVSIVHVKDLNRFPENSVVDPDLLRTSGLWRKGDLIKLLSDGELEHPLTVRVHRASSTAVKKVEAASGKVEVIRP